MSWDAFLAWFMGLGKQYGVNPIIFGSLYLGTVPLFPLAIAWLLRNLRRKKPIVLPALATGITFSACYLYIIVAGRNVPFWIYALIVGVIGFGTAATVRKVRAQMAEGSA